jgi:hypothetical protein
MVQGETAEVLQAALAKISIRFPSPHVEFESPEQDILQSVSAVSCPVESVVMVLEQKHSTLLSQNVNKRQKKCYETTQRLRC